MTNELFLALVVLVIFSIVLMKGSKEIRGLVAFLLIYGLWQVLEIAIFGNGFNDFVRDMFQRISVAFGNLANPDFGAFATLGVTIVIIGALIWLLGWGPKNLRAIAAFLIIFMVVRIFDVVALDNGFSEFAARLVEGLSNAFREGAENIP